MPEMDDNRDTRPGGPVRRFWRWLCRPSTRWSSGALLLVGVAAGIVFWGGFNTVMESTNTLEFCISCHEMKDTVYEEYRRSTHYSNPSGVRAICSDCHVPRSWGAKVVRKVQATNELYHTLVGTIDTPEKFRGQARRARAACLGRHEGQRLARVPQLSRLRGDGLPQAEPAGAGEDGAGGSEGRDLHRLPQGRRPQAPTAR